MYEMIQDKQQRERNKSTKDKQPSEMYRTTRNEQSEMYNLTK